jgi:hypothetical protein
MGCFFAQNLTVFEKPKPKDQCESGAANPSVFAARLRAGLHEGSEQTDPLKALPTTSSCWMGFRIAPCNLSELICLWFMSGLLYPDDLGGLCSPHGF